MCTVVGAIMGVISAASAAASVVSQNAAATATANAANKAAKASYELIDEQKDEVRQQAAEAKFQRRKQANRESSRMNTAFNEAGTSGNSTLHELANVMVQSGYDMDILDQNEQNQIKQLNAQANGVEAQTSSRIAAAASAISNPLMSTLKIGTSGVAGYSQGTSLYSSYKSQKTNTLGG